MIQALLLMLGALLNQVSSWHFMEHTFQQRRKPLGRFVLWVGILIVYAAYIFALPIGYAAALPVQIIQLLLCYQINWRQAIFYASLLAAMPAAIAGIVFSAAGCSFDGATIGNLIAFAGSGAIYTVLTVLLCDLTNRYEHLDTPHGHLFPVTAFIPLSILALLCAWMGISQQPSYGKNAQLLFACIVLILFLTLVFLLFGEWHNSAQLMAAQVLQSQVRKNSIDHDILREAREQQERAAILIHDIRRNLSAIAALAESSEDKAIIQYISSITQLDQLHQLHQYSGNALVNNIISRYCERCEKSGIKTEIAIRNADFTFIADNDLTAILDNLLENACEAAEKCGKERWLRLQIAERNVRYLVIKVENSAPEMAVTSGEELQTTKADGNAHGYGTKIIRRAAQRYNGEVSFSYDGEHHCFTAVILLQHP